MSDPFSLYTVGTVTTVPSTSNEQQLPQLTTLSDGNYLIVYSTDHGSSDTYHIYGQKYDTEGNKVGSETQLSTTSSNKVMKPVVAATNNGFVVVWSRSESSPSTLTKNYRRRFLNDMTAVVGADDSNEDLFSDTVENGNYNSDFARYHAHVATFSDGGYVVSYSIESGRHIYFKLYDSSGSEVTPNLHADDDPYAGIKSPGNMWFHWLGVCQDRNAKDSDNVTVGQETFAIVSMGADSDSVHGASFKKDGYRISSHRTDIDPETQNIKATRIIYNSDDALTTIQSKGAYPVIYGVNDYFLITSHSRTIDSNDALKLFKVNVDLMSGSEQDSSNTMSPDANLERYGNVTELANGDLVITYIDYDSSYNLNLQYYEVNGSNNYSKTGDPVILDTNFSRGGDLSRVSVPVTASGNSFIAAWSDSSSVTGDWDTKFITYTSPSGASGGDPHIIPLRHPNNILTLDKQHNGFYQYLNYVSINEQLSVNVMTWLMEISSKDRELQSDVSDFISTNHAYLRLVYFQYKNGSRKENLLLDMHTLRTVDDKLSDMQLFLCKFVNKKWGGGKNISISEIEQANNTKIIKYKTNNTPERTIRIKTTSGDLVFKVGNAKDNKCFNTYLKLVSFPKNLIKNSTGLLISHKDYIPIKNLK